MTFAASGTCTSGGLNGATITLLAPGSCTITASQAGSDIYNAAADVVRTFMVLPWTLSGFYQPIDMGDVWNMVKNGATVPDQFELFARSLSSSRTRPWSFSRLPRPSLRAAAAQLDDIEILSTGGTALRYDTTAGQFIYNWQTPKKAGFCYVVTITLTDGSSLSGKIRTPIMRNESLPGPALRSSCRAVRRIRHAVDPPDLAGERDHVGSIPDEFELGWLVRAVRDHVKRPSSFACPGRRCSVSREPRRDCRRETLPAKARRACDRGRIPHRQASGHQSPLP